MKKHTQTLALSLVSIATLSMISCEYENTYHEGNRNQYSGQNVIKTASPASKARPITKLPVRLGVVRTETTYAGKIRVPAGSRFETEADVRTLHDLEGVSSVLLLNTVIGNQTFDSYEELRKKALNYGIDILGTYHFDTNVQHKDHAFLLSVATLGLAPTHKIKSTTTGTFSIIDANSGYLYGVTNSIVDDKSLATGWGMHDVQSKDKNNLELKAYRELINKIPRSWNSASRQMR